MHQPKRKYAFLVRAAAAITAAGLLSATPATSSPVTATPAAAPAVTGPWLNPRLSPEQRADALLKAMTLDEKIEQIGNKPAPEKISGTYRSEKGRSTCGFTALARHIEGIPRLGIPQMREVNAGNGIRGGNCADEPVKTGGPSMTLAAASFSPGAMQGWGEVVGSEAKTFAHQILLGPAMNLVRSPYAGRAQEYPGEDPYLGGVIAAAQVKGVQSQGTQSMIKHFAGNEYEYDFERWTSASRIPARAMHELYLLPFEMTVKNAKPAAVMCAYPHVNFAWACESQPLLKQTLVDSWGFKGWIESDRRAMHSTVPSLKAGVGWELDEEPVYYSAKNIKAAIKAKLITEKDIDAVLRPRYVQMFRFGQFDNPAYNRFGSDNYAVNGAKARSLAEEGVTLLKNDRRMLPLNGKVKSVALIGMQWFAGQATLPPRNTQRDGLTSVITPYTVTPQQGIERELKRLGSNAKVTYNNGKDIASAVALAKRSDVVILMVGTNPRETRDLLSTNLPTILGVNQDALAAQVTKANPRNVVVLKTAAGVTMSWQKQTPAMVAAWFPGQDDGDVVAGVLFGRINPSGKTPVTWPNTGHEAAFATEAQYPGLHEYTGIPGGPGRIGDPNLPQLVNYYSEGLSMGYRWYEQNNVKPNFAFGHGLSYTTFRFSNLRVLPQYDRRHRGTARSLVVEFRVTNTGRMAGKEAAQVYLTLPRVANEPSQRLVGFSKIDLKPRQSKTVRVTIDAGAANHPFSYWVPDSQFISQWANGQWKQATGLYTVRVGGASDDLPLRRIVPMRF